MMRLYYKDVLKRLESAIKAFNDSDDPTERYALIQAINHIAENEIPIHGYWEDAYRTAMLREKGANVNTE